MLNSCHTNDTPSIENVNADEYDAIYLPGGHGTVYDLPIMRN